MESKIKYRPDGRDLKSPRFNDRIRSRGQELRFVELDEKEAGDLSHYAKGLACYMMSVDHAWRGPVAYGDAKTDQYLDDELGLDDPNERQKRIKAWKSRTEKKHTKVFMCYEGERVVGFGRLTDWTNYGEDYRNLGTQVSHLYVLPGYAGLGIARHLIQLMERSYYQSVQQQRQEKGEPNDEPIRLYLEATKTSEDFYHRLGYVDAPRGDSREDTSGSLIIGQLMYKNLGPEVLDLPPYSHKASAHASVVR